MAATEMFKAVFEWYNVVCKKTCDCDECIFNIPRKDCFTGGDIQQLIEIARKYDDAHTDGGADNDES